MNRTLEINHGVKQPRVCMVSLRGANSHAAWCSNYEFEDVICSIDDVDLFTLSPGAAHSAREWLARRMVWKPGVRRLTKYINPGLQPISVERDYDLFVFVCMNPADLIYLSAVKGWRQRCAKAVCFMVEFYAGWAKEYEYHLSLLRDFDSVALCFSGSVETVQGVVGRPCYHVPLAADVFRFSPFPNPPERCIDIYSMGRRVEEIHRAFLAMAARRELFYVYDTLPGLLIRPTDHRQHRELVANFAKRSRYFVAYPAKVGVADETRGQSEIGARYFEGAASGAVLVGQAPTVASFARQFDWPDATIELGSSADSAVTALARLEADPERVRILGRRNALEAIRRFDWCYRWREVLEMAGMQPTERLLKREAALCELAATEEVTA
jgi:hypothetical protein